MKKQFVKRKLIACMELHTFSSLNTDFIVEYRDSMKLADQAIIFISNNTIKHKNLEPISKEKIRKAFNQSNIMVFNDIKLLSNFLKKIKMKETNLLMMSSGNFENLSYNFIKL
jgi:UDP-N-acetylmuramate: L-alanyl-gamma-D-glutamyl-meso-diaminopimelate ligase